jgi:hypothetical protein
VPPDGIDIQAGKPSHARTYHVPPSVLKMTPALKGLRSGVTLTNTDPLIFGIVLEYLELNPFLANMRPSARHPLQKLIGGSDMMLRLVKAWHLAEMLELPNLQNKLIDMFTTAYRQFLKSHIRMPLDAEPFRYLRTYMFNHTRCEKFLVDFYAGLSRHSGTFRPDELANIPEDIAPYLELRRSEIAAQGLMGDRIAQGNLCFKVGRSDDTQKAILIMTLSVVVPLLSPHAPSSNPPESNGRSRSVSSVSTFLARFSPASTTSGRGHRPRPSLPLFASMSRNPERSISQALEPVLQPNMAHPSRVPNTRSVSMPLMTTQAPFMPNAPNHRRRASHVGVEPDSSDDESGYDLFLPSLHARNFPYHPRGGGISGSTH